MKLILILSTICSLSTVTLGATRAPIFQTEGISTCSALSNLSTDLNKTATYFHHITPENSPPSSLTTQLILGLKDVQTIFEDIISTLNIFNARAPSEAYKLIQPLFSIIRQRLQDEISTLESKVVSGQADEHQSRFLIDSLSKALDNVIERFNHSNWRKTCQVQAQAQGSEPVQRDVAADTLCLLFYALAQIIFLGLPFLANILGLGALFSYITLWVCTFL